FLDALAESLTHGVAGMPRGPGVESGDVLLRHVRRHFERPQAFDEVSIIVVLVGAERSPAAARDLLGHRPSGFPFRPSRRLGEPAVHYEPMAILDEHVPEVAELRLVPLRLFEEKRVELGDRGM